MPTEITGILRENVAALIVREDGAVLLGESVNKPGFWSFPQGGVNHGETRREALIREVKEEVGLKKRDFKILGSRGNYAYAYPGKRLKRGIYRGQLQTYFLCELVRGEPIACTDAAGRPLEFLAVDWVQPEKLDLARIPAFKRDVVREVLRDFFGVKGPVCSTSSEGDDSASDALL